MILICFKAVITFIAIVRVDEFAYTLFILRIYVNTISKRILSVVISLYGWYMLLSCDRNVGTDGEMLHAKFRCNHPIYSRSMTFC